MPQRGVADSAWVHHGISASSRVGFPGVRAFVVVCYVRVRGCLPGTRALLSGNLAGFVTR